MAQHIETFEIRNRLTNAVQVTAEITCAPDAPYSIKPGLAVRWAVKSRADLSGANLSGDALRPFKADLWLTLSELRAAPAEARDLIAKLRAGQVDGFTYDSENGCACLVGTIAACRGVSGHDLDHGSTRPAERWFMMIRPGDVPGATKDDGAETGGGFAARMALEWTLAWCEAHGIDPEAKPAKRIRKVAA